MKSYKPLILYIPLFVLFNIFLFVFARGSFSTTFVYFNRYYIYFNLFFASVYFYLNDIKNLYSILILSFVSLLLTLIILELIYPESLKKKIFISENIVLEDSLEISKSIPKEESIIPANHLDKASYYLSIGENSSAFIYADTVLQTDKENKIALNIKNQAEKILQSMGIINDNPKYIETLKYKNMFNQQRYLDAYYFCLKYDFETLQDYDFAVKKNNCLELLLNSYYSINRVSKIVELPGYSDIKFYYNDKDITLYSIEKLVEFKNEFYIKNLKVKNFTYPYIFINKDGKIFSKGFDEEKRVVYEHKTPLIPIKPIDLKLFSKELYNLSSSSLHFNLKLFKIKNIKYFNEKILLNLIITRISGYSSIFLIFFMGAFMKKDKDYLNFTFLYSSTFLIIRWYIKKISLVFISYSLSLSLFIVILFYFLLLLFLLKRSSQQLSLF